MEEQQKSAVYNDQDLSKISPPLESFHKGTIDRFFQSEVKPVHFHNQNDAILMLKAFLISFLIINAAGVLILANMTNLANQAKLPPNLHGFFKFISQVELAISVYSNDNQLIVGFLLSSWFFGYNTISAIIRWQFESREVIEPDDYEIAGTNRNLQRITSNSNNNISNNTLSSNLSHNNLHYYGNNNNSLQNNGHIETEEGTVDKSYLIVTMPDGGFNLAKKLKNKYFQ